MPTLVWKLLRQHISIGQLAGFFLANLFGMMIVLLSVQFYKDVIPVFTEGDSFMKKDFIIATKKISTLGSFAGKNNTFSAEDIADTIEWVVSRPGHVNIQELVIFPTAQASIREVARS